MSCDLLSGLREIASAIKTKNCCNGGLSAYSDGGVRWGSGANYTQPLNDTDAQSLGFDDLSEFDAHKCQAANAIVDGLIASLNNLSLLSLFNLVAGGSVLFAVGLMANPPVGVIALLVAAGVAVAGFGVLAGLIDDSRQELVCTLYNSDSAIDAYDSLQEALSDIAIEVDGFEIQLTAIGQLLGAMVTVDVCGTLYTSVGLPSVTDSVPCNCGGNWVLISIYQPDTGNIALTVSGNYAICTSSAVTNGRYVAMMDFPNNDSQVSIVLTGAVVVEPDFDAEFSDEYGQHSYQGYAQFISDFNASDSITGFYVKSAVAPFQVELTRH